MRQDHPELLTTLRDVAATAVTFLDAFAQIRRERTAPPTAASPAPPDDPDDRPDAPDDLDDAPDPARPMDAAQDLTETIRQQLFERNLRSITREQVLLRQRATAREHAAAIHQRLLEIAELASDAIDGDQPHTLPRLHALLEQLRDDFSDQHGPFAATPEMGPS